MIIASITTDIKFGPYIIPSNAQNMLMNYYAGNKRLSVSFVIPEPLYSFEYATTIWLYEQINFDEIILCSIHQLPKQSDKYERFFDKFSDVTVNFVIENIRGVATDIRSWVTEEIRTFESATVIDDRQFNWSDLYKLRFK